MLKKNFPQLLQAAERSTNAAEMFILFQTQLLYCKSYKLYYDSS